ncbi:MAG: GNAT family N-acetyltransferase [Myxococcota bacterium]
MSIVRDMQPKDTSAVERIFQAYVRDAGAAALELRVANLLANKQPGVVALVGLDSKERVAGYLVGEVRSWEFGSEPSGWIFALGVDPKAEGQGLGKALRDAAIQAFAKLGVRRVRTMVKKDDVRVLRFFRDAGFSAGPFVELELELQPGKAGDHD